MLLENTINNASGESLIIVDEAGHSMLEKGIQEKLIESTDKFAKY